MKLSIWDILTGLIVFGILCLLVFFGMVLLNPSTPLNPLKPLATIQPIVIPSATPVIPTATTFQLPPTWTPTPRPNQPAAGEEVGVPTLRPSSTPEPTSTVVVLPTFTPSKTTRVGGPGGAGVGGGTCQVIYQNPEDDTTFNRNDTFQTRWTIKNTSTTPWYRDSMDIRFMSGDRVHLSADANDMSHDVQPGSATDIFVDMIASRTAEDNGTVVKTSNWALMEGSRAVCRFYVTFNVRP
jgi:hypothetical protein